MTALLIAMGMENVSQATATASQDSLVLIVQKIPVQCCAAEMENMRKVTVCVEMAGKDQSVMFQKSSVLIQPALAMVLVSWVSASVSLDTKERFVRKRTAWIRCALAMVCVSKGNVTAPRAGAGSTVRLRCPCARSSAQGTAPSSWTQDSAAVSHSGQVQTVQQSCVPWTVAATVCAPEGYASVKRAGWGPPVKNGPAIPTVLSTGSARTGSVSAAPDGKGTTAPLMVAQVSVMEMGGALLIRMGGTVFVKWAGVARDVTLSWKWCVQITWTMMEMA